jgi:hypothetical protein
MGRVLHKTFKNYSVGDEIANEFAMNVFSIVDDTAEEQHEQHDLLLSLNQVFGECKISNEVADEILRGIHKGDGNVGVRLMIISSIVSDHNINSSKIRNIANTIRKELDKLNSHELLLAIETVYDISTSYPEIIKKWDIDISILSTLSKSERADAMSKLADMGLISKSELIEYIYREDDSGTEFEPWFVAEEHASEFCTIAEAVNNAPNNSATSEVQRAKIEKILANYDIPISAELLLLDVII